MIVYVDSETKIDRERMRKVVNQHHTAVNESEKISLTFEDIVDYAGYRILLSDAEMHFYKTNDTECLKKYVEDQSVQKYALFLRYDM